MHSLSLSTKQASWLGFGCNKFHKFHSSTPASQITMCLMTFVHIQELLQDACQAKYCMQTPKHARWKKLNSSVILTELRQCDLMVLFFQTILEYLLQITFGILAPDYLWGYWGANTLSRTLWYFPQYHQTRWNGYFSAPKCYKEQACKARAHP